MRLSPAQKKQILETARKSIEHYSSGNGILPDPGCGEEALCEPRGAFVTLRKNGRLRGCIGRIFPDEKLYLAVRDMAVESAFRDPRFSPVTPEELKEIDIEISALTVPEKAGSAQEIELGRDGVIIRRGINQGVYLPQVASETGWDLEEFMGSLCSGKAGLERDAWKDPETEILTFRAEVFSEKEMGLR